jgi:hypothetical protein
MKKMKKTISLFTAALLLLVNHAHAQNFKELLLKTYLAFDTTQDQQQKVQYSNKFDLLAKKFPDEWAAHYYNAFSKAVLSYNDKDEAKRDAWLDEAERERDEAVALLKKENDETYVLAAMIANARLAVKPQARWQKFGKIFEEDLAKAKDINPDNPRIYYLQGMSKRFTPKMFGGGKKAALPYFEKAASLFAKETDNEDIINHISWGKATNQHFLKEAQGEAEEQ